MKATRAVILSFAGAILLASIMTAISVWAFVRMERRVEARWQSSILVAHASALFSSLVEAETGQQGYSLTGQDVSLEPYRLARGKIDGELRDLRRREPGGATGAYLDAITPLVQRALSEMDRVIALRRNQDLNAAVEAAANGPGKALMDSIREQTARYTALERGLVVENDFSFRSDMRLLFAIIISASGLTLLIALLCVYLINWQTQQRVQNSVDRDAQQLQTDTRTKDVGVLNEKAVLASELRYRRLFETAQDGILILDAATGQVVDANPFMKDLLGYSQEEFLGRKLWEIGPFKGEDASKSAFAGLQKSDRLHYEGLPLETKDGRRVEVEFISNAYLVDLTRLIHINIRDITERMRASQALEAANKKMAYEVEEKGKRADELVIINADLARSNAELEQFAYVATHDLQEPLRAVASCVQLLQKRYGGQLDARADEFIVHAVDGTKRMQTLINDLLEYSRISTHAKLFAMTNCESVLRETLANLAVSIEESGAEVTHDPMPTISGDSTQLTQLFQNLIANALKFRGERPPKIHVGATLHDAEWSFSVADNGIGMEPQYFERVFLVFQRLHTRKEYKGTGIGLAICKKVVERHGGRIWAESEAGKGAKFCFTIPERNKVR